MKIEGRNAVNELLKTDAAIDKILAENSLRDAESRALLSRAGVDTSRIGAGPGRDGRKDTRYLI